MPPSRSLSILAERAGKVDTGTDKSIVKVDFIPDIVYRKVNGYDGKESQSYLALVELKLYSGISLNGHSE